MKVLITLIFLAYIPLSLAKSLLHSSCTDYETVAQSDFILLNKTEFIQLGECVGRALLEDNRLNNLAEACSEVIEDKLSPLGILSLSKVEAIKIGQCLGAVAYVHDKYQGEKYDYYSNKTYHCTQGDKAAKLLSLQTDNLRTPKDVRSVICEQY